MPLASTSVNEPIALFHADILPDDVAAVAETVRGNAFGHGQAVRTFEAALAARVGRTYAVAAGSLGTSMRIALTACGVGPGHEVVVPAFAPIVVANAVAFTGAYPRFADVDPGSLNATPATVEPLLSERTKAIVASPNFGNPAGLEALGRLAAKWEIPLIENATEILGCRIGRDSGGRFGRISVIGLPPGGLVCGGDGAVIVTHDDLLADACRSLRDAGRPYADPEEGLPIEVGRLYEHERIGFDSRLDELRAALATSQLGRLERSIARRKEIVEQYTRRLGGVGDLLLPTLPSGCDVAWPNFVVRLAETFGGDDRDLIIRGLHRHDIGASNPYPVAALLPFYASRFQHAPGAFPVAERMSQRTIALPFHHRLGERDVDLVCQTLELMIKRQMFRR
jgi:perosamine synthetase